MGADHASKVTDKWSVSGGAIMRCGAFAGWFSRIHRCVTLSATEAEYAALGDALKELLFLRQVWRFMLLGKGIWCYPAFVYNQKALCNLRRIQRRTRIPSTLLYVLILRQLVHRGDISVYTCSLQVSTRGHSNGGSKLVLNDVFSAQFSNELKRRLCFFANSFRVGCVI